MKNVKQTREGWEFHWTMMHFVQDKHREGREGGIEGGREEGMSLTILQV